MTGTLQTYAEITSDEYLQNISKFVVGIGPAKDTIVAPDANNYLKLPTDLVSRAHAHNLQVIFFYILMQSATIVCLCNLCHPVCS